MPTLASWVGVPLCARFAGRLQVVRVPLRKTGTADSEDADDWHQLNSQVPRTHGSPRGKTLQVALSHGERSSAKNNYWDVLFERCLFVHDWRNTKTLILADHFFISRSLPIDRKLFGALQSSGKLSCSLS